MISFRTVKNRDTCQLDVRHWDGYDRPSYFRIMAITEDELDLDAGRFERYLLPSDINKSRMNHQIYISDFQMEDMINWIDQNTQGKWIIDPDSWDKPVPYIVYFELESDAVLCRMMLPE